MATQIHTYSSALSRPFAAKKLDLFIEKLIPRSCMVVSTGAILVGLSIPFLILCKVLPSMLLLYLAGYIITLVGSISALIFCGEI
jgi:hypothetical protein